MKVRINTIWAQFVISLNLIVSFCFPSYAAEFDENMPAQPATLSDRRSSLQNRLQFPKIQGDIFLLLLCTGELTDRGRFSGQINCFRDEDIEDSIRPFRARSVTNYSVPGAEVVDVTVSREEFLVERFEREVIEAANYARMEPARLEGKRAPVKFNFAVKFERDEEQESIEVYLHHFRNMAMLGTDYIAAQRFLGQQSLFAEEIETCPKFYIPVWIRSIVMNNGSAYNIKAEDVESSHTDEEVTNFCVTAFKDKMKTNLYVPTISGGRYVNAFYIELFYDNPDSDNYIGAEDVAWDDMTKPGQNSRISSMVPSGASDSQANAYREWLQVKGILPGGNTNMEETVRCTNNEYIIRDPSLAIPDCKTGNIIPEYNF